MYAMHCFHASILKAYDVRGIVGETLFEADAEALGFALSAALPEGAVVVARDGRVSSPALHERLMEGLVRGGRTVMDVGLGPTPLLYFSVHTLAAEMAVAGGVMVTGSHNPPTHNGFKIVRTTGPFFGDDIQQLPEALGRAEVQSGGRILPAPADIAARYREALLAPLKGADILKNARVVWDVGNGAAGTILPGLLAKIPGQHTLLNGTVDGDFPGHPPDPTVPAYLTDLMGVMARENAHVGFAFDGDADRVVVVLPGGEILSGDVLLTLFAEEVLKSFPGATIIADVKVGDAFFETVARTGGVPLMWKTGHSHIKQKMAETGAVLAGEVSGHLFFKDTYGGFDDGLYGAMRFLALLANSNLDGHARLAALPKFYATPERRLPCDDARIAPGMIALEAWVRTCYPESAVLTLDGIRVRSPRGWWLVRASHTQACIVVRAEGRTAEDLEILEIEMDDALQMAGLI